MKRSKTDHDFCPLQIKSEVFTGLGISPGTALGPVCLFEEGRHNKMPIFTLKSDEDVKQELERYKKAKEEAIAEIEAIYSEIKEKVGKNEAAIFYAHKVILSDEAVDEKIEECIKAQRMNIEYCVTEVFNEYEDRIASMDNEYMRERGTDFGEIKRRILDKLGTLNPGLACQGEPYCDRGTGRVIVAHELTPSLTVEIDREPLRHYGLC
jgi:phosphotransferase system enzyme I (PtsI)